MPHRPAGEIDLAPAAEPADTLYEQDFVLWTQEQARLIREGRWTALDQDNVAEEIESLGREQFAKLRSALRVLLMHMLKWDHQVERRSRSWISTILAQRSEIEFVLEDNPSLRPRIPQAIASAYRRARLEATQETGMSERTFPEQCPYSWDDIVGRDFPS